MNGRAAYPSFCQGNAEERGDIRFDPATTAVLVLDVQETCLKGTDKAEKTAARRPYFDRMRDAAVPNCIRLVPARRARGVEIVFARTARQ